jgi:hypothetical protein
MEALAKQIAGFYFGIGARAGRAAFFQFAEAHVTQPVAEYPSFSRPDGTP